MPVNITQEFVLQLMEQVKLLNAQINTANAQINTANVQIEALQAQNKALTELIETLNETIKTLTESKNKSSKNSSKPPSSDGLSKAAVNKSLRQSKGLKQGGQLGHTGTHLNILDAPTHIVKHMHSDCANCSMREACITKACTKETRRVVNAAINVEVTVHECLLVKDCPLHSGRKQGYFPEDVKAPIQYGVNLQSLVVSLNTVGAISMKRVQEILGSVFGIPLSTGTINSMVVKCADLMTESYEKIYNLLLNSTLNHFDETGIRVDGKTRWAHVVSNMWYTYLTLHDKRGHLAMDDIGFLANYQGIAIHDCWASYWRYANITHGLCDAHLLRELISVEENHPSQTWATEFIALLLQMKKAKEKAMDKGMTSVSAYYMKKFNTRYSEIIKTAFSENPLPPQSTEKKKGRKKQGKVRSLIIRLETHKASVCLFLTDFQVPFDNNQAERDLRNIKVKTKVSGCFRTLQGASNKVCEFSRFQNSLRKNKSSKKPFFQK